MSLPFARYATAASLLLLADTAFAQQTSTLTLPFFGYDTMTLDASIIAVRDQITTMSLNCGSAPGEDCGLGAEQTLTIGPSTYNMFLQEGTEATMTQDCVVSTAASMAVCVESQGGSWANTPGAQSGVVTGTYTGTDFDMYPVTVTAGASLLGAVAASTTMSAAAGTGTEFTHSPSSVASSSATSAALSAVTSSASTTQTSVASSKTVAAAPTTSTGAAAFLSSKSGGFYGITGSVASFLGWALL